MVDDPLKDFRPDAKEPLVFIDEEAVEMTREDWDRMVQTLTTERLRLVKRAAANEAWIRDWLLEFFKNDARLEP